MQHRQGHATGPISPPKTPRLSRRAFLRIMMLTSAVGLAGSLAALGGTAGFGHQWSGPEPPGAPAEGSACRGEGKDEPHGPPAWAAPAVPAPLPSVGRPFVAWDRRCGHPLCPALVEPGLERRGCPCRNGVPAAGTYGASRYTSAT